MKGVLRPVLLCTGLLCLPLLAPGQEEDCLSRLDDAEVLFNSGIFEDIPALLNDCLESYSPENKQNAYRLIVLSQYLNDDVEEAEEIMLTLLKEYPEYRPAVNDLADFRFLYESFRVRKILELGVFTGPVFTQGHITEPYNPFQDQFVYSGKGPGISAGIHLGIPINPLISIGIQPAIRKYTFQLKHRKPVNGIYRIEQAEHHAEVRIPLFLRLTFLNGKQLQPYIKTGGALAHLFSAGTESRIERLDPETNEILNTSENIKRDHLAYRQNIYYYLGGGLGLKMNFNKYYLFIEGDYLHPMNNVMAPGANRFDQGNLWSNGWVDSDFRLSQATVRAGIVKSIYWIKKIR